MEKVTVTITTDKPVKVKITPYDDLLDEILDNLECESEEKTASENKCFMGAV